MPAWQDAVPFGQAPGGPAAPGARAGRRGPAGHGGQPAAAALHIRGHRQAQVARLLHAGARVRGMLSLWCYTKTVIIASLSTWPQACLRDFERLNLSSEDHSVACCLLVLKALYREEHTPPLVRRLPEGPTQRFRMERCRSLIGL